ncbi:sulfatase-like hydrolase/transferase [Bacteroides reticulotermitis]|uniref:sulfatase-like hydrolase/transferase n=1 Tax=Bacteroides reticulotermitis TaxID=1133319 RepID=UPI003A8B038E
MKHLPLLMCTAFYGLYSMQAKAADKKDERPNILWLTFEDTSAYEFGCYGNNEVHTPNTDSLAACGIQFMNAWSVAPQSSAARSSLITGCYATTYGMDVHPVAYDTPADIFFPQKLREAGYYCTNNNKTHYNSTTDNKICWDECDNRASYNSIKRQKDQPFFAVFNTVTSHMGRIRTFHTDGRRDYTQEGIYPALLSLPSYVPDLPEMRSDYAGHLEAVQDVDTWLGFYLKDLKEKGLDENTIIFFFSDHGGCLPRGKGYLYESGLKVPLIAYFPPKWQHLANNMVGKETDLVNFTDLGPTVLSLAGVKPPKHMHGKALYGKFADKNKRDVQFALAANQLHHFMPVRAATDGRFKYIRSYIPYRQFALRNYYQWGMPSNKAWDKLVLGGQNTNPDWKQTFEAHSAEMLFDLEKDPDELHDLSGIPEYADVLAKMRRALSGHIRTTNDLGFFLPDSRTGHILYEKVRQEKYPLDDLYLLVETAGTATPASLPLLEKAIVSPLPEMRFWGVVGYAKLAREKQIKTCPQALLALLQDTNAYIASEAAYAVSYLGKADEGVARLVTPLLDKDRKIGYSSLECLSLDSEMRDYIRPFVPELKKAAETLPRLENEAAGLMARGILVNLGELKIEELHGPEVYERGLKLNHGRRAMLPLPY